MSAIKLNSSGGGSITISPASTASTLTLTAPAQTGTIGIQGPAFAAYANAAQTIGNSTYVKVQFNVELFDTANCYDSTTNYRFTPNVEGYYQVNATCASTYSVNNIPLFGLLYKNASIYLWSQSMGSSNAYQTTTLATLVYMNGTTDFLEMYVHQNSGTSISTIGNSTYQQFSAFLARGVA